MKLSANKHPTNIACLSRTERCDRIGYLLAKGVALLLAREEQRTDIQPAELVRPPPTSVETDPTTALILHFLRRVKQASPRDLQRALDLPKATVYRRLTALVQLGQVDKSGSTTAVSYRLMPANIQTKPAVANHPQHL